MMPEDQPVVGATAGGAVRGEGTLATMPSTPRAGKRQAPATGNTPAAKRPLGMDEVMAQAATGQVGIPLDADAMLKFLYRLNLSLIHI